MARARSGFWVSQARVYLPEYAWALDEIAPGTQLDPLVTELELITGARAEQLRTRILAELTRELSAYSSPSLIARSLAAWGDTRMMAWCLASVCEMLLEQRPSRFPPVLFEATEGVRQWVVGRLPRAERRRLLELVREVGSLDATTDDGAVFRRMMRSTESESESQKVREQIMEGAVIFAGVTMVVSNPLLVNGYTAEMNAPIREALLRGVATFPVYDPR